MYHSTLINFWLSKFSDKDVEIFFCSNIYVEVEWMLDNNNDTFTPMHKNGLPFNKNQVLNNREFLFYYFQKKDKREILGFKPS